MHWRNEILSHLAGDVRHLVPLSAHPEVPWSVFRRRYPVQLDMGLVLAGEVMVGSIVRRIPSTRLPPGTATRWRTGCWGCMPAI